MSFQLTCGIASLNLYDMKFTLIQRERVWYKNMYVTECYQSAGNQKHIYTPQKINKYLISFIIDNNNNN